jgi:nicotinamidase/pyrazinamidase
MPAALGPADALLVVDVQVDFCPGGALPVADGDAVVAVLNRWIAAARRGEALVVASRDWHPAGHVSFVERGGPWPPHCVAGTPGAAFHPDLALPRDAIVLSKGTELARECYSAFGGTDLERRLRERRVERLFVGGLALDYCVRASALDARKHGFETHLVVQGTRPVEVRPGDGARALAELRSAGAILHEGP